MPLYLEYDASILFFLFFLSCFFFVLTQKPTIHTLLAIKTCIIPALGQKRKKISSDAFISRIRCLYFLFLVLLKLFFFVLTTDHSYFTCHKKLYYSCSGSKTKKKSALMPLYLEYDASILFFLFFLSCFFFVLTHKPTNHTLLAIKNCIIPALGQKRKKNQLWCLYIFLYFLVACGQLSVDGPWFSLSF